MKKSMFKKQIRECTQHSTKNEDGKVHYDPWTRPFNSEDSSRNQQDHVYHWWEGVVKDYEPKLGKHWIQYKVVSKDGHSHEPQDIVSNRAGDNVRLFQGRRTKQADNKQ